jgi:hypothetical protein
LNAWSVSLKKLFQNIYTAIDVGYTIFLLNYAQVFVPPILGCTCTSFKMGSW